MKGSAMTKPQDTLFSESVERLGQMTADQIADTLRKFKVRGRPSTFWDCPLARLLDIQCASGRPGVVGVGKKQIMLRQGMKITRIKTPPSLTKFLVRFDVGDYPDLFAPPPRSLKPRPGDRHKIKSRQRKHPPRKTAVRRDLVKLLGGRGQRVGS